MKAPFKIVLAYIFASLVSTFAMADAKIDSLLAQIDGHISAKRLSTPVDNNAIASIWEFKSLAPFDQRINDRVYQVGAVYVGLANNAIAKKKYSQAQRFLDLAWSIAYLTPGLEAAQDKVDVAFGGKVPVAQTKSVKAPAAKPVVKAKPAVNAKPKAKPVAKKANTQSDAAKKAQAAKAKAQKEKQLEAARLAKQKADLQVAERRRITKQKEQELAKLLKVEQRKRDKAAKLAARKAQSSKMSAAEKAIDATKETSKPIARFELDQQVIDNRDTRKIRPILQPMCQEVIDNEASVVLHTKTTQDYRWLMVRLTLCARRIDKSFRLRHSHKQISDGEPSISLHPGRDMSLLKQRRY